MRSARLPLVAVLLLSIAPAMAQFGPAFQYICEGPRSVDLADVDADGDLDLIIGSRQGLGVYLNTDGQGTMDQPFAVGNEETVACLGDLDGNGQVDGADLAVLLGGWGGPSGDLDGSGTTDGADLAVLLGAWGPCP